MTRERLISEIANELEKHDAFKGKEVSALVWATRIAQRIGLDQLTNHPFSLKLHPSYNGD